MRWVELKPLGIFFSPYAADVTVVCPNCADILQSGTSLQVASSRLAHLVCWALPYQGRLCPAMASSTWPILSPREKNIQRGASLGKFCFFFFMWLASHKWSKNVNFAQLFGSVLWEPLELPGLGDNAITVMNLCNCREESTKLLLLLIGLVAPASFCL